MRTWEDSERELWEPAMAEADERYRMMAEEASKEEV